MSSTTTSKSKKRSNGPTGALSGYLYKLLKQLDKTVSVSGGAMVLLEELAAFYIERLADDSGEMARASARRTITSRDVLASIRLRLPGDLGRTTVTAAILSETKFAQSYYPTHGRDKTIKAAKI